MPSTVNYQWQISSDSVNWSDITAANNLFVLNDTTITLTNYDTDQLTVSPTINSLNGYKFRVKISNPAFVCAGEVISDETMLIIRSDFDGDGIEDDADVDDDNDGIWDINEGNGAVDTDGDGDPDTRDPDLSLIHN